MSEQGSWKVRAGRTVTDAKGQVVATAGTVLPLDDECACLPHNRSALVRVFEEPATQTRQMGEDRNVAPGEVRKHAPDEAVAVWDDEDGEDDEG